MTDDMNPYGIIPPPPPPSVPVEEHPNPVDPVLPVAEEKQDAPHKYKLVRGGGDPIYLVTPDQRRHWILNPLLLGKLGYKFGDEERKTPAEISAMQPGEPITFENWEKYA